jgi:NADPH-dependent 2,4-dienoyl-CoA reductase/sulfur reductase-like enzyme
MGDRLVVVGGVAGGMSAAAKARRVSEDMEIVVYERSSYISYAACGLPYYIKGEIPRIGTLIERKPEDFAEQGIDVKIRHEVVEIDPEEKEVRVRDHVSGKEFKDNWDKLVLGTGASAIRPPIPGMDLRGIFTLKDPDDGIAIASWLEEEKPESGVIVGGGYIGLEMAEALSARGVRLTLVEMLDQVMPSLDLDSAELVAEELTKNGVELRLDHKVEAFEGDGKVSEVVAAGKRFPADIVVFAVGIRPNTDLAEAAGISVGETGAIAIDEKGITSHPDVLAAGDVAEVHHLVLDRPVYMPLGSTANKQGRVAGVNAAGGKAVFSGIVGTSVFRVFDLGIAQTGLSEAAAKREKLDVDTADITASSRARYMPEASPIKVRLVYEKESERVLGAQMLGREGVAKRVDIVACALHAGWTVDDLSKLDLSYSPPFSPVWDPVLIAANVAGR